MTDTITQLRELPELVATVWDTWDAPNPAPKADRHIRSVPGSRPPTDVSTYDLLRRDPLDGLTIGKGAATSHLLDRLGMCARMVEEERDMAGLDQPHPAYGTWVGLTTYLLDTIGWWQHERGVAEDIAHEIAAIHHALSVAARTPVAPVYKCDKCGAVAHEQPGGQWMLCESGHQVEGMGAVRDRIRKSPPLPASRIEEEYGVRADTIRQWKKRGLIQPECVEKRKGGRPIDLWAVWDVLTIQHREAAGDVA